MNIVSLLNQSTVWIDKDGTEHKLAFMTVRYKRNVVDYLVRNADRIEFAYSLDDVLMLAGMSEAAQDAMGTEAFGRDRADDPEGWLRSTALVKEMQRQIDAGIGPASHRFRVWYGDTPPEVVDVEADDKAGAIAAAEKLVGRMNASLVSVKEL